MLGEIFDLIGEVASGPNWRYWFCVALALIISVIVHLVIPGNFWDWFISIPLVILSIAIACVWENKKS